MRIFLCVVLCCVAAGCTSGLTREQQLVRTHVVDACYIVLEMAPVDKDTRISTYLQAYENGGLMTDREVYVLKECIKRTEGSSKWRK